MAPSWEIIAPIVGALVVLGLVLGLRLSRWMERRRGRAAARRGLRSEAGALRLLERRGFRVLDVQQRAAAVVEVDGEPRTFHLHVDAIVRRGRRRYVAEFKTGQGASIGYRATRRQLLEYAVAYPGHGLLLVDASEGTMCEIDFPGLR